MAESGNGDASIRQSLAVSTRPGAKPSAIILNQEHFEVFVAQGKAVIVSPADAQQQFIEHYCHVVVIAPRLLNPTDPKRPLRH